MFERFTEQARQVVVLAQEEARILRHNYIGTEHILLGLLREEEGLAAQVLEAFDVTIGRAREQVRVVVGTGAEVTSGQIPFTPHAKGALERALREALALGHNYIGTEHLLLGLLREGGVGVGVLTELGPMPEAIRGEILPMLPGAPGTAPTYRTRLGVIDARLAAAKHRDELIRLITEAEERGSATAAVQRLLSVSREEAESVLDMRLGFLTRDQQRNFEQERQDLVERLAELDEESP